MYISKKNTVFFLSDLERMLVYGTLWVSPVHEGGYLRRRVGWGEKNRFFRPQVIKRADRVSEIIEIKYVFSRLLPCLQIIRFRPLIRLSAGRWHIPNRSLHSGLVGTQEGRSGTGGGKVFQ